MHLHDVPPSSSQIDREAMERAIALTLAERDVGRIEGAKCSRRVRAKKLVDLTDHALQ